jgi:hypothetical protein
VNGKNKNKNKKVEKMNEKRYDQMYDQRIAGNGRVGSVPPASFQVFSDPGGRSDPARSSGHTGSPGHTGSADSYNADTMARVWTSEGTSDSTRIFLSRKNVDALQDAIRYRVYVETDGKHVIGRQSDVELSLVMRSVLLQEGKNVSSGNVKTVLEDVRALNASVIAWCVPRVVSEVKQYTRYLHDASTLPVPMERGMISSQKGSRQI